MSCLLPGTNPSHFDAFLSSKLHLLGSQTHQTGQVTLLCDWLWGAWFVWKSSVCQESILAFVKEHVGNAACFKKKVYFGSIGGSTQELFNKESGVSHQSPLSKSSALFWSCSLSTPKSVWGLIIPTGCLQSLKWIDQTTWFCDFVLYIVELCGSFK